MEVARGRKNTRAVRRMEAACIILTDCGGGLNWAVNCDGDVDFEVMRLSPTLGVLPWIRGTTLTSFLLDYFVKSRITLVLWV